MKMKISHILQRGTVLSVAAVLAISCNDAYLERYPLSDLSPENYFTNEN